MGVQGPIGMMVSVNVLISQYRQFQGCMMYGQLQSWKKIPMSN